MGILENPTNWREAMGFSRSGETVKVTPVLSPSGQPTYEFKVVPRPVKPKTSLATRVRTFIRRYPKQNS